MQYSDYSLLALDILLRRGIGGGLVTTRIIYNGKNEVVSREVTTMPPDVNALKILIEIALKEQVIEEELIVEMIEEHKLNE